MIGLLRIPPAVRGRPPRAAGVVLALAAALVSTGPAAQTVHRYVTADETFVPVVLIGSDGVLVGLEAGEPDGSLPRDQLIVHLPSTDADSLCVSIRSIDGRYEGTFQFAARLMRPGPVLVDVRSPEYPRERASYAPGRLAVHASLAGSCSAGTGTRVLTSRTRAAPAALRLSLNADAGMLVRAEMAPTASGSEPVRCPLVREHNPFAFNRTCTVPLPPAGPYQLRLTVRNPPNPAQRFAYPVEAP
jgi:hypothetical protein